MELLEKLLAKKPEVKTPFFNEFWDEIEKRKQTTAVAGASWVDKTLRETKENCVFLFSLPCSWENLNFQGFDEWVVFYSFLVERFVRTNTKVLEGGWEYISEKITDPLRGEVVPRLTSVSVGKADLWLNTVEKLAQNIAAVQRYRGEDKISIKVETVIRKASETLAEARNV